MHHFSTKIQKFNHSQETTYPKATTKPIDQHEHKELKKELQTWNILRIKMYFQNKSVQ